MQKPVQVGLPVPSFAVKDLKDNEITSKKLHGTYYVLYFFPKSDTPGCTLEACGFRDHKSEFDKLDVPIIAVSPDSKEVQEKFEANHQLNFVLIPDPQLLLCELFDVLKEKTEDGKFAGIVRTTFIVDDKGVIRWMEKPVNIAGHIERVLHELQQLASKQA